MSWIKPGLATAIGSMPYTDLKDALSLISKSLPKWPHWPQLTGYSEDEGFTLQYVQPLLKLGLVEKKGKDLRFTRDKENWEANMLRFYELYLAFQEGDKEAEDFFALKGQAFCGFNGFREQFSNYFKEAEGIKAQLSGPLSIGVDIKDETGKECFYDKDLLDILLKCLATQGLMQIRALKKENKPILMFIDDPAIFLLGTAGYITLKDSDVQDALRFLIDEFHKEGVKVGVHICGRFLWSVMLELPLDVISFDAYHLFDGLLLYPEELKEYLERDGKLAWGIVPTEEEVLKLDLADLQKLFSEQLVEIEKRGIDPELLKRNIIWTPSCGTGTLSVEATEHIYKLLSNL